MVKCDVVRNTEVTCC